MLTRQYPGTLAWGITIHKAQGSTYESMIGNMNPKYPATPGQTYTMLSRVKTRKGLKLINFHENQIKVNKSALDEMHQMNANMTLEIQSLHQINTDKKITIAHLNIRSLQKHYQDLIPYITDINLDALCLTETHTDQYNKYKIHNLPNIYMLKSNHGSAIYSQKTSKVHQQYNRTIDMLGTTTNNILTIFIYIPPNRPWYTIKDPVKELLEHTNTLAKENNCKTTIITGDFNHDLHNPSEQITELFKSYNFI